MSVAHPNSVEKIIFKYFAAITKVPFTSNGVTVNPKPLIVSSTLARGYTCPPDCGACCPKFTLDYIEGESTPEGVEERYFEFNGNRIKVWSDLQTLNTGTHCRHVSAIDARCAIHADRPFSCDFELVRTYMGTVASKNRIGVGKFGRSWNLTRAVGGAKGTLCEITPPTAEAIDDTLRKLERLKSWANYFGLTETWLPEIMEFLREGKYVAGNRVLVVEGYIEPEKERKTVFKRTKVSKSSTTIIPGEILELTDEQKSKYIPIFTNYSTRRLEMKNVLNQIAQEEKSIVQQLVDEFPDIAGHTVQWDSTLQEFIVIDKK